MRDSGIAGLVHKGLIGFLILGGVLMAVAMIPLIILILLGMGIFSVTTPRKPREITRQTVFGTAANGR